MITIRFDGKEHDVFQFSDMLIGDLFVASGELYVRCPAGVDEKERHFNAINMQMNHTEYFPDEYVIEPIKLEFMEGDDDGENDLE